MARLDKIYDENGKQLSVAEVVNAILANRNNHTSDSQVMIGMRGLSKNIPCIYRITPVGYEPHRIDAIEDL